MRKECGKKSSYQGFKYHIEVYHAMESLFHALYVEMNLEQRQHFECTNKKATRNKNYKY